jgi:hypothetical protein
VTIVAGGENTEASIGADGSLTVASASGTTTYTCEATNDAGQDTKAYGVSTISAFAFALGHDYFAVAPRLLSTGEQEINITQGAKASLACGVDFGDQPPPDIVWLKDGRTLDTFKNPTMLLARDRTQLDIGDTRLTDAGRYSCIAQNPAGNATVAFVLNVGGG